jgi:hypothetical protein
MAITVHRENTRIKLSDLVDDEHVPALRSAASDSRKGRDHRYFDLESSWEGAVEAGLGFVVGIGRLPQAPERVLCVTPREFRTGEYPFRVDHLRMYAACAADPDVSRHLDECLSVYDDEAPIDAPDTGDWSPLIALAFVKSAHELVQRHLRRGFVSKENELRGRIRGQVAFGRYAATSLARGRPEVVPCRFQALEQDTLENRILRTALAGARRLLDGVTGQRLGGGDAQWRIWTRQVDSALAGAAVARIMPRDFLAARKSGAYRHYARPLALARAVLTRTGFDPNQHFDQERITRNVRLVPFRLATAELFERYVEVCLRGVGLCVWAGYNDQNLGKPFKVRPDFLARKDNNVLIVDAKYKDLSKQQPGGADDENPLRRDIYQTLGYSRHKKVLDKLAGKPSGIILCYPAIGGNDSLKEAGNKLTALLEGRDLPGGYELYKDFDIPIKLVGIPTPTAPEHPRPTVVH